MKVDSAGQPVAEGTFGFYGSNMSAKVVRTFVDPSTDDEETQGIIADGGYMVDIGDGGVIVVSPDEFTATYDGDTVKAQDGQVVKVGDKVLLVANSNTPGPTPGKPVTIRNLYPIGTLKETWCASIEEGHGGSAPDGKYGVQWGNIASVVERAKAGTKAKGAPTPAAGESWEGKGGVTFTVGDTVRVSYSNCPGKWRVRGPAASKDYTKGSVFALEPLDEAAKECSTRSGATHENGAMLFGKSYIVEVYPREADTSEEAYETPEGDTYYVGSIVRIKRGDYEFLGEILKPPYRSKSARAEELVSVRCTEILINPTNKAPRVGNENAYFTSRIVEVLEHPEHINADTNTDTEEGEEQMAVEKTAMSEAQRSKKFGKVEVVREGTQIILPTAMGLRTAIAELQRQAEQEEMDVNIMELIEGFPLDAAHAFVKALELKYGWVNALPTPGFFGPQPPTMIGVQVDPDGRTVQIPWGQLGIPGISGKLSTGIQFKDNRPVFCIGGTIKQKDKFIVNEIAQMARTYLKENSIYRGKAIRVKFPDDPKKFSPLDHQPKFIQTADVRPEELIFSAGVEKQVRVNIWTPIQSLAAVKAARVPLKRGVLLYGRYGVGKTLLASVTARMAVQAGVTFMDLEDSRQLPQAVQFARMFGGMVVIFAEDIDRCDENGTRTDAFNDILNTVDGLTSKTDEVLIVYTTNHIEKISKAMLRQGRIDKVINIKAPDADAAQRLVRLYARHMLHEDEDLSQVGELLVGFIPAAIREVVEQSKLAAIERGDVHRITSEDLKVTVENTLEHMDLLKETPKDDRSDLEKLGDALGKRVGESTMKIVMHMINTKDGADWNGRSETGITEAVTEHTKRQAA